jgi:AAA15 family ATPase/GTPase
MRITNINIENFKAIDSLQFNPRMLNIFVGRNNTGKTSILQAIKLAFDKEDFLFFFRAHASSALKYGENKAKLEMKLTEDKRSMVDLGIERVTINEQVSQLEKAVIGIFERTLKGTWYGKRKTPNNEERKRRAGEIEKELKEWLKAEIILEMVDMDKLKESTKDSVNLIINGQNFFLSGSKIDNIAQKLALQISEKFEFSEFLGWGKPTTTTLMQYITSDERLGDFSVSFFRKEIERKGEDNFSSPILIVDPINVIDKIVTYGNKLEGIAHEIEQIIINDNIVPGLTRFNFHKMVFEGVEEDVSMDSMGDGFKALIGILASLYQRPKNTIVLLEEPEVHMHPGYLQELAKYLVILSRTRNIQLFISTHSMDFIQCFLNFDSLSPVDSEFVRSQFFMLQLSHLKNVVVSEEIDYYEADQTIKDLELDLRGI